ncbi:polysaccharide deacetylase family protein [Paenibacillus profundus]|uniref:Polysaccharide deacetylase family protein n=1 Tax=Paenibacillus profundus TaxID=1173085 RepID=A0ABS8YLP1_9BACL|nr:MULTISPECIES: polysaccharide deacetylase family protein [Paenibacillus]MCE5172137.1 polysaccharide deacetylase family protein [Paenibacillus profundus]
MRKWLFSLVMLCLLCTTGCFPRSRDAAPPTSPSQPTPSSAVESARPSGSHSPWNQDPNSIWPRSIGLNTDGSTASPLTLSLPKKEERKQERRILRFTINTANKKQLEHKAANKKDTKNNTHSKERTWNKSSEVRSTSQSSQSSLNKRQNLSIAQLRMKYPHIFKLRGKAQGSRQVALTFDDVPDNRATPLVLDILKEHNIRATFFLVGSRAKAHPELVQRIVREGHIIGNHSYNHPLLTKLTLPAFEHQLKDTERVIEQIVGYKPRYFRPPYGEISEKQLRWAGDHGYLVVNWDVDSNDWRGLSASQIIRNVVNGVSPGSIVLQHAGGSAHNGYLQGTVKALPAIINRLKAQNYEFVTVSELLQDRKEKRDD